jgi:hypothetical protein
MTSMNFLFRKPRFPIIVDTGTGLIGAKSWAVCEKRSATITFPDLTPRDVIDSTAEAFFLYPEHLVFSPLTFKKRWTKAAIIDLYNSQKGPERPEYPTTSLDNKSLEKVVKDTFAISGRCMKSRSARDCPATRCANGSGNPTRKRSPHRAMGATRSPTS